VPRTRVGRQQRGLLTCSASPRFGFREAQTTCWFERFVFSGGNGPRARPTSDVEFEHERREDRDEKWVFETYGRNHAGVSSMGSTVDPLPGHRRAARTADKALRLT